MKNKFITAIICYIALNSSLLKAGDVTKLSQSDIWNNIIFYEKSAEGKYTSLLSESHLLSITGNNNPLDELEEEISLLKDKNSTHIMQCNYPRRTKFIKENLKLDFATVECDELNNWLSKFDLSEMKVFITSGKVEQPQSMFGHIFLAVPSKGKKSIMTYKTISYMADTSDEFIKYGKTIDGLVGNYKSEIIIDNFYNTHKYYSIIDSRGMWEYTYNDEDDIENIMLLIYELKNHALKYYFIDENCASSTMKILTHNRKNEISSSYYLPIDLIRNLHGNEIISFSRYWPSDKEIIFSSFESPNNKRQREYNVISKKISSGNYNYEKGMEMVWDNLKQREKSKKIMTEGKEDIVKSHRESSFTMSNLNRFSHNWIRLNYALGHHDFLSPIMSKNKGTNVTLFDSSIIINSSDVKLEYLKLFEISTIQDSFNNLPSPSWTTSFKYERYQQNNATSYTSKLNLYYGFGKKVSNFSFALMSGPKLKYNRVGFNGLDTTFDINAISTFQSKNFNFKVSYIKELDEKSNDILDFSLSYNKGSNYSLSFSFYEDDFERYSRVGVTKYF